MRNHSRVLASLTLASALFALGPAAAHAQVESLSARQLFYQKPKVVPATPAASGKPIASARPSAAKGNAQVAAKKPNVARPQGAKPAANEVTDVVTASTTDTAVNSQEPAATLTTASVPPLAIRYRFLKLDNDPANDRTNPGVEVSTGSVFRSGDRIRLLVEANQDGYVYLINRGTSGVWKPLVPSKNSPDNFVRGVAGLKSNPTTLVTTRFDEQPGEEMLFLVFSRQPRADLDDLVGTLRGRVAPAAPSSAAPNRKLDDSAVSQLRRVYSRDLVVEKIDDAPVASQAQPAGEAPARESAVYVASTSRNPNDPLIADIKLIHK